MANAPKVLLDCFLCRQQFRFGPQIFDGHAIKSWNINVCEACHAGNWDGVPPEKHPRLVQHLRKHGIPVGRNANGWIEWPRST